MIRAETGGSEKVSGRSMAMVAKRPQARQHADGGAEQAADEGVEQVPGRERGGEAQAQIVQQFHRAGFLTGPGRRAPARASGAGAGDQ